MKMESAEELWADFCGRKNAPATMVKETGAKLLFFAGFSAAVKAVANAVTDPGLKPQAAVVQPILEALLKEMQASVAEVLEIHRKRAVGLDAEENPS